MKPNQTLGGRESLRSYELDPRWHRTDMVYGPARQIFIGEDISGLALGALEWISRFPMTVRQPFEFWSAEKPGETSGMFDQVWPGRLAPKIRLEQSRERSLSAAQGTTLSESFTLLLRSLARSISPELAARVRDLLDLEHGWDGEDAKPVRMDVLARTVLLLRPLKWVDSGFVLPFIAPTFDGFVLLDWTSQRRTLEVQAEANGWSVVGTLTSPGGKKEYFSAHCDQDASRILNYYKWFRDQYLLWPTE